MTALPVVIFATLLFFTSCESDSRRNTKGGLKRKACALSKKLVVRKVNNSHIRLGPCLVNNVIFQGNSRYEVNSYFELPKPSGKLLRYNYFTVLKFKDGDACKEENWNVEKVFIEVFAN